MLSTLASPTFKRCQLGEEITGGGTTFRQQGLGVNSRNVNVFSGLRTT